MGFLELKIPPPILAMLVAMLMWWSAWVTVSFDVPFEHRLVLALVIAAVGTGINPYAAEAPEEFFAVCSEYHFSMPELLRETMPEVAMHLRRFYGASPFPL